MELIVRHEHRTDIICRQLRIKLSYVHVLSIFFDFSILHIIVELDELYRMVLVLEFNFK